MKSNHFLKNIFLIVFLILSFAFGIVFYLLQQPWVDFSILAHYNPGKPSILLDDEGNEWGRFQLDKREIINFNQIPKHVINAFIAAEDWNFFNHSGLSYKGIIRSVFVNLYSRRKAQGASTITQQLVRLLYFDNEKSFIRKFKEQILAITVEQQFTKEHILETYLNHVYLGSGIYGIEAASQRFWAKHVTEISIDQAAILASIVQAPNKLSPLNNPNLTLKRRNHILSSMQKLKLITKQEYDLAIKTPIKVVKNPNKILAPHLKETIRQFLEETFGREKLYCGGLKIQTTLNLNMQKIAENIFEQNLKRFRSKLSKDIDGALISIDGATGQIKAIIGGYDFTQSQFNRALKANRQMGSIFKPLVYAQALASGKSFADIDIDEPISIKFNQMETFHGDAPRESSTADNNWNPRNHYRAFHGSMTLAQALALSNNIVTIKTFLSVGAHPIINLAKKCKLTGQLNPFPSLALGCVDATPEEAVGMFNIFAHNGTYVKPHYLSCVKDQWGKKIWKQDMQYKEKVLPSNIASQVAKVLTIPIEKFKKKDPDLWFDFDALGKTGTTNDARSCWFAGSTAVLTTVVYIGNDNNKPLGKEVFASQTVLPIWREFNKQIGNLSPQFKTKLSFDPTLKEITINKKTGLPCIDTDKCAIKIFAA